MTLEELIKELAKYKVSSKTLEAMKIIKREYFVEDKKKAYLNEALPFYSQTTSQPLVIANVIDNLELNKEDVVIEAGTGSGFQTCLLAFFSKKVFSFEIDEIIFNAAQKNIQNFMEINKDLDLKIELIKGNIFKSEKLINQIIETEGKIDKVVFSFAIKKIPDIFVKNAKIIIAPIEENNNYQKLKKIVIKDGKIFEKDLGLVSFVKQREE